MDPAHFCILLFIQSSTCCRETPPRLILEMQEMGHFCGPSGLCSILVFLQSLVRPLPNFSILVFIPFLSHYRNTLFRLLLGGWDRGKVRQKRFTYHLFGLSDLCIVLVFILSLVWSLLILVSCFFYNLNPQ